MMRVVITTAIEMTAAQLERVKKATLKKYGKDLSYDVVVDPSILGGIQIAFNSHLLDGSLKTKIEQLQNGLHHKMMETKE